MKIFKSYTFVWWQIGILKIALLAIGAIIGSYWHNFFRDNLITLIVIAVIAGVCMAYAALKQSSVN